MKIPEKTTKPPWEREPKFPRFLFPWNSQQCNSSVSWSFTFLLLASSLPIFWPFFNLLPAIPKWLVFPSSLSYPAFSQDQFPSRPLFQNPLLQMCPSLFTHAGISQLPGPNSGCRAFSIPPSSSQMAWSSSKLLPSWVRSPLLTVSFQNVLSQPFPIPAVAVTRLFCFLGYHQRSGKPALYLEPSTKFLVLTGAISEHKRVFWVSS